MLKHLPLLTVINNLNTFLKFNLFYKVEIIMDTNTSNQGNQCMKGMKYESKQ